MARLMAHNRVTAPFLIRLSSVGLLPAAIWKRLPVDKEFRVSLPSGESFLYSSIRNDAIGRALHWAGLRSWEAETVHMFWSLACKSQVVIDVGANTGIYTLLALKANPSGLAIAFEPVPRIFQRLQENIAINGLLGRCQLRAEAVSSSSGMARLHVPYGDVPTSSCLDAHGFRGYAGELVEVPMKTIDAVVPSTLMVDLIKIDVEGFEAEVLKGMTATLERCRPTIIIECNPDGPYREVEQILQPHGYSFFHLRDKGPARMANIHPDVEQRHRNYMCVANRE